MRLLLPLLLAAAASTAMSQDVAVGRMHIVHPWARATVHGQRAGGAYLEIDNRGNSADRLLSVRADVAADAQLHSMKMEGNVMRMREVGAIDVPAGGKVALEPGGLHIMLTGLKAPLAAGSRFPMRLMFEKAGEVKVDVAVESAVPAGPDIKH